MFVDHLSPNASQSIRYVIIIIVAAILYGLHECNPRIIRQVRDLKHAGLQDVMSEKRVDVRFKRKWFC